MTLPGDMEPLADPLQAVERLLVRFGERGVIIGGAAISLIGKPRYTEDIDAVVLPQAQI